MKKNRKKSAKNKRLQKIARAHAIFSFALFSLYVALSAAYSPEFLLSDVRSKFSALADETVTITAKVLGPPIKPVVTIQSQCANNNLSNLITWPSDENSTTFDIDRDGLPLVTNLTNPAFQDSNVSANITYAYVVTAHGTMGSGIAVSDQVSIDTTECVVPPEPSTVKIISIDSNDVASEAGTMTIESLRPLFSGNTSIPNAIINVVIHSSMVIFGQTLANANGFWSWQSPVNLSQEQHTIFVTATNPNNANDTITTTANFIIDTKSEQQESGKKSSNSPTKNLLTNIPPIKTFEKQLDFSFSLSSDSVFENNNLSLLMRIDNLSSQFENTPAIINYSILDQKSVVLYSVSEKTVLFKEKTITKDITLPSYIKEGSYRLKMEIQNDFLSSSKEIPFVVKTSPILNLGGGITMTYPELLSNLGTFALSLLIALLLWLFLFSREYWLSLHALRGITEKNLEKLGLISLKKRS